MTKVCILHTLYYNFSKGKGYTVEPPLTATCLYNGHFFWRTVNTFTLVSTSLQWPLSSVPKVATITCNQAAHLTSSVQYDKILAKFGQQ